MTNPFLGALVRYEPSPKIFYLISHGMGPSGQGEVTRQTALLPSFLASEKGHLGNKDKNGVKTSAVPNTVEVTVII